MKSYQVGLTSCWPKAGTGNVETIAPDSMAMIANALHGLILLERFMGSLLVDEFDFDPALSAIGINHGLDIATAGEKSPWRGSEVI